MNFHPDFCPTLSAHRRSCLVKPNTMVCVSRWFKSAARPIVLSKSCRYTCDISGFCLRSNARALPVVLWAPSTATRQLFCSYFSSSWKDITLSCAIVVMLLKPRFITENQIQGRKCDCLMSHLELTMNVYHPSIHFDEFRPPDNGRIWI